MFPDKVFYAGSIWAMGYSNLFGTGYRKLTATLKKHPKHKFMYQTEMLKHLKGGQAEVAINPKPSDEIYDTETYSEWLIKQQTTTN